jgi:hypothetical protein
MAAEPTGGSQHRQARLRSLWSERYWSHWGSRAILLAWPAHLPLTSSSPSRRRNRVLGAHILMDPIPNEAAVRSAVELLFKATRGTDHKALWNALVPNEAQLSKLLPPGQKQVTYVPSLDARELIDFVLAFSDLQSIPGRSEEDAVRIMLTSYCHIMESELMPALIWNQLRLLAGKEPSWRFTRVTKAGNEVVCWYPKDKYAEIVALARTHSQPIGDVIDATWDGMLRNAFSHARYHLVGGYVLLSKGLSPISRAGEFGSGQARSYPFAEIRGRFSAAKALLFAVAEEHEAACRLFNQPVVGT